MGWLTLAGLGIIWCAVLFPSLRWERSPSQSVEEFERTMDLLAEANGRPGRWVIMPAKGERFMGTRGRTRTRARRRRRQIVALLAEATGLATLIGLVPPLHSILLAAGALGATLVAYLLLLVRIRAVEVTRAELLRARRPSVARRRPAAAARPVPSAGAERVLANGRIVLRGGSPFDDALTVMDDDVHVVVHRSDEIDLTELRAAAGVR